MLKPHEQRVVDELTALEEKLDKLKGFIGSPLFDSLSQLEQNRLDHQVWHMQAYSDILTCRIRDFND